MKFARYFCLLVIFAGFSSVTAFSQSADPVVALKELLSADKIADAARHYPVAVEEVVRPLKGDDKADAAKILLMKEKLGDLAVKLNNASDGTPGEAVNENEDKVSLTVVHSFVSGVDALIVARFDFSGGGGPKKFFSLHFEAGEWRLRSIGIWMEEENFESDKFMQELLPGGRNEMAAEETLAALHAALLEYRSTYRSVGLPSSLAPLSGPMVTPAPPEAIDKPNVPEGEPDTGDETGDEEESSTASPVPSVVPEHAYLVDPAFMQDPARKDGYLFHYNLIDSGLGRRDSAQYQITATPVEFGKTGKKSYFINQTGVIRFTTENRDANENDEALSEEQDVGRLVQRGRRIIR